MTTQLNPDTLKDLREIANLAQHLVQYDRRDQILSRLGRIENDLERLTKALNDYGYHLSGHGCDTKKHPGACNCGPG